MCLREFYKKINNRHPALGALIRRIYHRKILNITRKNIRGKNNTISHKHTILNSVLFKINGSNNFIELRDGCILNNVTFRICGNNHRISIGSNCRFNNGGDIWIEDDHCTLEIGNDSTFEKVHLALTESYSKMYIGQDCMFAYDIDVRTGDSHSIISTASNERLNHAQDVVIGDHVWVAAHCIILKGVRIPEDSVIATGSVVTRSYQTPGILIGGNPARQLKEGISWVRERIPKTE